VAVNVDFVAFSLWQKLPERFVSLLVKIKLCEVYQLLERLYRRVFFHWSRKDSECKKVLRLNVIAFIGSPQVENLPRPYLATGLPALM
jgi:hypothetical protein